MTGSINFKTMLFTRKIDYPRSLMLEVKKSKVLSKKKKIYYTYIKRLS